MLIVTRTKNENTVYCLSSPRFLKLLSDLGNNIYRIALQFTRVFDSFDPLPFPLTRIP